MSRVYGFPYQGSKTKLAERIVAFLPRREHLYELFCGGCAISHRAMVVGKYPHIHINDINTLCPQLFYDAITGKYENEDRWISREDFNRLKETDGYVASCFSFGSNFKTYAYNPDIEPKKKALHYAVFFGDYSLAEKELGVDLSPLDKCATREKKYLLAKRLISGRVDLSNLERLNRITPPQWSERKPWKHCTDLSTWKGYGGYCQYGNNRPSRVIQQTAQNTVITPPITYKGEERNVHLQCRQWITSPWRYRQTHVSCATSHISALGSIRARARVSTTGGFTIGRKGRPSRCSSARIGCQRNGSKSLRSFQGRTPSAAATTTRR